VAVPISPDELSKRGAISDPYPVYRHLRRRSPFQYVVGTFPGIDGPIRSWALIKYSDVYGAV
jgi:hypothetical protein